MEHPPLPKRSNKITDIVRLQQILKKWKKIASKNTAAAAAAASNNNTTTGKTIKLLKKTLSFSDLSSSAASSSDVVPKGFLAVCVGKELKRFIIPTEYLGHRAFEILLREAEEEFGFQQEGVLKIPCEVAVFEKILKIIEERKDLNEFGLILLNNADDAHPKKEIVCINGLTVPSANSHHHHHHPQLCR